MSKPMSRVFISILLCLAVLAMIFTIAYAASTRGSLAGGRIPADAGLTTIVGSDRTSIDQTYQNSYPDVEKSGEGHGGCESEYNDSDD